MALPKIVLSGVLAGGLVLSGVTWTGTEDIQGTKGIIDTMKGKFVTAVSDNEFLKAQFNKLNDLYTEAMGLQNEYENEIIRLESELNKANAEIDKLKEYAELVNGSMNYTPIDKVTEYQVPVPNSQ